jgi:hypothetical protein
VSDFAGELAGMPEIVHRLLLLHVADSLGRCRACTRPGTGKPAAAWPCALHFYADAAQQQIRRRQAVERGSR